MSDLSRKDFEFEVAKAFAVYCDEPVEEWIEYAQEVLINMLESESIEYGDPDFSWSAWSAQEMALEDTTYWEFS